MTGLLYFETVVLMLQIFLGRLYKSSIAVLYIFICNTFVSPVVYYELLNGSRYITFTQNHFDAYVKIGCSYLFIIFILNFWLTQLNKVKLTIPQLDIQIKNTKTLVKVFAFSLLAICISYVLIYRDYYPLIQQLTNHVIMHGLDRPDVSGSIPLYFTMSTIMSTFFPMYYYYSKERLKVQSYTHTIIWNFIILLFMAVGGNKGIVVYFAIFIWLYVWNRKIDFRMIIIGILLFCLYETTIYGSILLSNGQFLNGIIPPLRRFFVTQGAMFLNRIPVIESGIDLSNTYISAYIYNRVYHGIGGSAPTYFLGDLIVQWGYVAGFVIGTIITAIIFVFAGVLDNNNGKELYKYWAFYYILYLLGNSSISVSFFIRFIIVGGSMLLLQFTDDSIGKNY